MGEAAGASDDALLCSLLLLVSLYKKELLNTQFLHPRLREVLILQCYSIIL